MRPYIVPFMVHVRNLRNHTKNYNNVVSVHSYIVQQSNSQIFIIIKTEYFPCPAKDGEGNVGLFLHSTDKIRGKMEHSETSKLHEKPSSN